jgi:DNA-binding transcriptional ArsR family regulator
MTENIATLAIHPVRLRILQSLVDGPKSTQEISSLLSDIPTSSLYRHLKVLLDGEIITVEKTRLIRGIQEKVYKISQFPHLSAEDISGVPADEHLQLFTTYVITLLQGYSDFLKRSPNLDFEKERVGYSEVNVWATNSQLGEFGRMLNEALAPLMSQGPGEGRHRHKLAIITHPVDDPRIEDD